MSTPQLEHYDTQVTYDRDEGIYYLHFIDLDRPGWGGIVPLADEVVIAHPFDTLLEMAKEAVDLDYADPTYWEETPPMTYLLGRPITWQEFVETAGLNPESEDPLPE